MFDKNKEKNNVILYYSSLAIIALGIFIGASSLIVLIAGDMIGGIVEKVTTLVALINVIIASVDILTGYYGYKNYNTPENASILLTLGGICTILACINLLNKSGFIQLLNFIIPLVYTFEAYKMKTGMTLKDILDLIKNKKTD